MNPAGFIASLLALLFAFFLGMIFGKRQDTAIERTEVIYSNNDQGLGEDDAVCNICFEYKKNAAFDPCGHTACNKCALQIRRIGECHMCRQRVNRVNKIFL